MDNEKGTGTLHTSIIRSVTVRSSPCYELSYSTGNMPRAFMKRNAVSDQIGSKTMGLVGKAAAQDNGLSERRILTGLLLLKSSRS